jgi:peptide deformylase
MVKMSELVNQLKIVKYPHPALRYKSKPVKRVDRELGDIVRKMFDLMYEANGIGLAANQVNLPYRLFVINLTADPNEKKEELVFLNPVILRRKGFEQGEEGCLSLPDLRGTVRRSKEIDILAYNLQGEEICWRVTGLLARAFQHELDHLDGILFIDHLEPSELLDLRGYVEKWEDEYMSAVSQGAEEPEDRVLSRLRELEALRT